MTILINLLLILSIYFIITFGLRALLLDFYRSKILNIRDIVFIEKEHDEDYYEFWEYANASARFLHKSNFINFLVFFCKIKTDTNFKAQQDKKHSSFIEQTKNNTDLYQKYQKINEYSMLYTFASSGLFWLVFFPLFLVALSVLSILIILGLVSDFVYLFTKIKQDIENIISAEIKQQTI